MIEDLEGEVWKDVVGWEDYYKVSNKGRIKSIDRVVMTSNKWGVMKTTVYSRLLKPSRERFYDNVNLYREGKMYSYPLHRLIAMTFISNPENKPQVNHIDANKKNNHLENLEWVTRKENIQHAMRLGLKVSKKGADVAFSKLDDIQVKTIRSLHRTIPMREIANYFKVNRTTISAVIHRYTWKHLE